MKFRIGRVPENPEFHPEADGWLSLKEPSPGWAQVIALPVGFGVAGLLLLLWYILTPMRGFAFPVILSLPLIFIMSIPVHELIHFFTFPNQGRGQQAVLGFWPRQLVFYAHYEGVLSRNRFLMILVNPFLVITLLPLLFCAVFRCFSSFFMLLSLINALSSSLDLLGFLIIFLQIPAAAAVRNQSWKTYYKLP